MFSIIPGIGSQKADRTNKYEWGHFPDCRICSREKGVPNYRDGGEIRTNLPQGGRRIILCAAQILFYRQMTNSYVQA